MDRLIGDDAMNTKMTTLALIACSLLPVAASAEAPRVESSRQVAYSDLDLASTAGRDHLDKRIALAVRQVCGSIDPRALSQVADIRRCRREAANTAARGRELALSTRGRREGVAMMTVDPTKMR
jgi:UrcA family protein